MVRPVRQLRLLVLDDEVDIHTTFSGGSALALVEKRSCRAPTESPVFASWSSSVELFVQQNYQSLTEPADRSAVRGVPLEQAILNGHARGAILAAVDLSQGGRVLLAQFGELETLGVVAGGEVEGGVLGIVDIGNDTGNGVRLRGVQSSRVATAVGVLSEKVSKRLVEAVRALRPGVNDEILRRLRLRGVGLAGYDEGAADRAEHEGGGREKHCENRLIC